MSSGVNPNQPLQTVLKGCPRLKGEEPEMIPEESIDVPKGCSYYMTCLFYGVLTLVFLYSVGVAGDFFGKALPKVASDDCAEDKWHTTKEDACHYVLQNALTMGFDPRCYREKPSAMLDKDFEAACGDWWQPLIGIAIAACLALYYVTEKLGTLPGKVCLYRDFMTVVAANGDELQAIFYDDITAAESSWGEITLSAKAVASYTAPDEGEEDEKVGCTLSIQGETSVTVACDKDEDGKAFSDKLATKIPVPIEGLESTPFLSKGPTSSMLAGRLQEVIDARSSEKEYTLQIPKTCDMAGEYIFTFALMIFCWYVFTLIGNLFDWSSRNGTGNCKEIDDPDVDYCSIWLIFWPIKKLSSWADYLDLAFLIIGLLVFVPLKIAWSMDKSYHFDQAKIWTAPCDISEAQELDIMFWDDVSNAEVIATGLENKIQLKGSVKYKLTGGAKNPFQVTAEFKDDQTQDVKFVDARCAACCCQGHTARVYDREVQSVIRKFLPGINMEEVAASDEDSEEAPLC